MPSQTTNTDSSTSVAPVNNSLGTYAAILGEVSKYGYNPFKIQRAVFNALDAVLEDDSAVVDPTTPFGFSLETAAVLTAGAIAYDNDLTRRQYPAAANNIEDLYYHMADVDYLGRFSYPTVGKFTLIFDKNEIISRMVEDDKLNIKKVVIPRNTFIKVGDLQFTFEYPLEIRQLPHGGLQIIIDNEIISPIKTLSTNQVNWEINKHRTNDQQFEWLLVNVNLQQLTLNSYTAHTTRGSSFVKNYSLSDYFYYARVFYQDSNRKWVEMATTHCQNVYDIAKPTALLKVMDNSLRVSIPKIYVDQGYLDGAVRVDVYETKGKLNVDLSGYFFTDYTVTFRAIDDNDITDYVTALDKLNTIGAFSKDIVSGGRGPLSFRELRSRVINNSIGQRNLPITNTQIEDYLEDDGFNIVKNIDNVTNRVYLASQKLPKPIDSSLITPASASMETVINNIQGIIDTGFAYDNYESVTIMPSAIYESLNGIYRILTKSEIDAINALGIEDRVEEINGRELYYTPFYYVIDYSDSVINLHPYHLDNPQASNKTFVESSSTASVMQVSTDSYLFERIPDGWRLTITTASDSSYLALDDTKIQAQLAFVPDGEIEQAYINGTYIGKTESARIFQFDILTDYKINTDAKIEITNSFMFTNDARTVYCPLTNDFQIYFTTTDIIDDWSKSSIDDEIGSFLLPDDVKALVHEQITLQLGYDLENLWHQCRTTASPETYDTYPSDVPLTYTYPIYDTSDDPSGVSVDNNGNVTFKVLHKVGDPVLDDVGNQLYAHRKGDTILDANGNPTVSNMRDIFIHMDIMLIEYAYQAATSSTVINYRNTMTNTYVNWITDSLQTINDKLLEQTQIFFYPVATLGEIKVAFNQGLITSIPAAQSLYVELVVTSQVYNNIDLRDQITSSTVSTIANTLNTNSISKNIVLTALTEEYRDDVLGVKLTGLGQSEEIITMTILDDTKRCSLKKILTLESDNSLFVSEDVTVSFIEHVIPDQGSYIA